MKIRKMSVGDIEAVAVIGEGIDELAVSEISRWWSVPRLTGWVKAGQDILLVAEENQKVVGVILTALHLPTKMVYLSDVVVSPAYRGKGIARALINTALEQAKQRGVSFAYGLTQPNNLPIQKLLAQEGFRAGEEFVWYEKKPL